MKSRHRLSKNCSINGKYCEIFGPYNFWTSVKSNISDVWNWNFWTFWFGYWIGGPWSPYRPPPHPPTPCSSTYTPVKSILFKYAEYGKVCVFYNNSINYFIFVILRNIRDTEAVAHRCFVKTVFLEILQNSQENTCSRVSYRCFPVNFAKHLFS